jgi:hypothetical protein
MGYGLLFKSLRLKLLLNNRHKKAHTKVWANILLCCRCLYSRIIKQKLLVAEERFVSYG